MLTIKRFPYSEVFSENKAIRFIRENHITTGECIITYTRRGIQLIVWDFGLMPAFPYTEDVYNEIMSQGR